MQDAVWDAVQDAAQNTAQNAAQDAVQDAAQETAYYGMGALLYSNDPCIQRLIGGPGLPHRSPVTCFIGGPGCHIVQG